MSHIISAIILYLPSRISTICLLFISSLTFYTCFTIFADIGLPLWILNKVLLWFYFSKKSDPERKYQRRKRRLITSVRNGVVDNTRLIKCEKRRAGKFVVLVFFVILYCTKMIFSFYFILRLWQFPSRYKSCNIE